MPTPASELEREQAHLEESREQLGRMRERTASMDASGAADWVSREYLQSTFELRMRQLADDPTVPLFFGRLDYQDGETFHIGRRHVSEPGGEPMVVDWRAAVSLPFYRATTIEPMGVDKRRRYGFQHGRLTAYEDEDLTRTGEDAEYSAILEAEIERPRVGPMRDIVATIQPEQDVIVRADVSRSIARARSTGHRQDGRRPAPGGVPPLRAPRPAPPPGRPGGRSQRQLPALHPGRAARPRRDRGGAVHDRGPGRQDLAGAQPEVDDPRGRPLRRRHPQGRRAAGTGARARGLGPRRDPHAGSGPATWRAPVPGRDLRGRGGDRGSARPRCAVRRRPGDASPGPRPPRPAADGARRRLSRRPGAGGRGPQPAGQGVRRHAVAGGRSREARAPPALRRRRACRRGRRHPHRRRAAAAAVGQAARPPPAPRPGHSPTRCCSTRPPTWWSGRRRWATSWSTRRRTSHR